MSDDAHRQRIFSPFGKVAQLSGTSLSQADAHMQHYSIAQQRYATTEHINHIAGGCRCRQGAGLHIDIGIPIKAL